MKRHFELGSEFYLDVNDLNIKDENIISYFERKYDVIYFDSGRSAIKAIEFNKFKLVLLPEYICGSVIDCFNKDKIVFYSINEDLSINEEDVLKKINSKAGLIVVVNYFGHLQDTKVLSEIKYKAEHYGIVVVEDNTQSIFSYHDSIADYMLASIRKWLPIPNGGVLYRKKNIALGDSFYNKHFDICGDNKKVNGMILKKMFLYDDLDVNLCYREIFCECENSFFKSGIAGMSDLAKFIAQCFNIQEIIKARMSNYKILKRLLLKENIFPFNDILEQECPFVFLLNVDKRDPLHEYLINNRIFCAVHWPFDGYLGGYRKQAKKNADRFLSLPIDQRYSRVDLEYMADVIRKYRDDIVCYI